MDVQRIELEADRIVAEELDRARQKIIEHHVASGQRTTGTTADSITIAVTTNGGVTTGTMDARPYFAALETGTQPWLSQHFRRRRDGSVYPSAPKWFIDIIADWAAAKGVDISAWGAATKIMTGRNGGRKLKKIWQELGVPPWLRDTTPLLFYGETLIAAAGVFVTQEGVAVGENGVSFVWQKTLSQVKAG